MEVNLTVYIFNGHEFNKADILMAVCSTRLILIVIDNLFKNS